MTRSRIRQALRPLSQKLRTLSRILRGKHRPNRLLERRIQLGKMLAIEFNNTVRYGPFKGLKLPQQTRWGKGGDVASMLLGIYELEVVTSLRLAAERRKVLIDLGAANGYFGLGALVNGMFDYSYCFERSLPAREIIAATASLNGLSERVRIEESAESGFWRSISHPLANCVLLVDIEGGEFDLLDDALFDAFRGAIIVVELHDWFHQDAETRLAKLRERAVRDFRIAEITTGSRDLSGFAELSRWNDDDRWIVCSEGRGRRMMWWRLDPR